LYLKSLELHGFKSFPDRTVLKFNSGATVIVGPNGSGKSNITDAMRWVLGELSSKNIRGSKMEDVIFAGASDKKPMSFAEVSVTFDDSEEPRSLLAQYDEVTVTRRYYRSGDSEYFINRKKVRLKDIYQLFMNTGIGREGYSIIGQGKIAEIVSKKSEDRRGVFEESAGISKYRYKKTESEKKLAETEANMERIGDIEDELSRRIGPLEKDAEKARRYLEMYGEKKKVDISLWLYDSQRLKKSIEKTENDTRLSAHELEMIEDSIKVTSAQIERLYEQSHSNKEASRKNYEETTAMTKLMTDAEAESKVLTREKIHDEAMLENEKQQLSSDVLSISQEEEKLNDIADKITAITSEQESENGCFSVLTEKKNTLDISIREKTDRLDLLLIEQKKTEASLTDTKVRLNVLESNIQNQEKRAQSIGSDISAYDSEIAKLQKISYDAKKQIEDYQAVISGYNKEIAEIDARLEEKSKRQADLEGVLNNKRVERDSLESRIAVLTRMHEHFDGYNNSVKFVMNEVAGGRLSGIRGPLSHLIKVENKYIVAIETSVGAALQNIVTDDEHAAKRSIELLKRNNAGRATFYPLTTIRAQERGREYIGLENSIGFVGWADELVSSADEYRNIVRFLLARVAVFDNIDNATEAARTKDWRIRAVTLDGQQINAGGSFTGGQTKRDSGMLSRAVQIEALEKERGEALSMIERIGAELSSVENDIAGENAKRSDINGRRGLIEALISAEQKNFSDADGKLKAMTSLLENMKKDMLTLSESTAKSGDDLARLKNEITELAEKVSEISSQRENIATNRGAEELEISALIEKIGESRIRLAELSRDLEAAVMSKGEVQARLSMLKDNRALREEKIKGLIEKIHLSEDAIKNKQREAVEYEELIRGLRQKQTSLEKSGDEIETRISRLRQQEKEQNGKKDIIVLAHSKNEAKLSSLKAEEQKQSAKIWDDYELTYAAAEAFASENDCHIIEDGERNSFISKQTELKNKIRALGHVNVDAVEEYNEVKTRYEYIREQLGDLRKSREDILKILSGIEQEMKEIFLAAFNKINTYFNEVFGELFGGGHAEVILTDPENALESGIEIIAAPPGKTIKNLNLLSGGEQAFIAIALLFALIRVNPSPFCIFDEIEAALDEVNVARVGKYVKKYSEKMQIIMISHRRGTMDIADSLYGVTMQQSGVSKVFTLSTPDEKDAILK